MSVRVVAYRNGACWNPPVGDLPSLLEQEDVFVWADLGVQGPEESRLLEEVFGVHPLLVEDAFEEIVTPKIEFHEDLLYVVAHGIDPKSTSVVDFRSEEVDFFVGGRFLVTQRDQPMKSVETVWLRVASDPERMARGPAWVMQAILDVLTHRYEPVVEAIEGHIEALEVRVFKNTSPDLLEDLLDMRHALQRLRRTGRHQLRVLQELGRAPYDQVPDECAIAFRDVYDTWEAIVDRAEAANESAAHAMDSYLAVQSHRLNEVMRVLTLISTIMLPLGFFAGVFGMNFDHMPELHWTYGYAYFWGLMLLVSTGSLALFRWRGWL